MTRKILYILLLPLYPILFILLMILELIWLVQFKPKEMQTAMWESWKDGFFQPSRAE